MELLVDYRWLLARQEDILCTDLTVNDLSVLVGMAARHRVDPPRLDHSPPDAFWRAAVFLEECVLLRPLPARNEAYGYGVAVAYLKASGESVDTKYELWRDLINDIRILRLDSYGIAEHLRSFRFQH
ncbi:toxin Doc [Streptomyces agglomeratus]|uniref:Toxin Doc n=1 Tax=Streptomyces agglomeratus TaxID=285458 RepID=A0A1E5NYP7_9ACTN|nr:toxin Doc [Streptomyces agglomeratus]OEJ21399.1 toxin Doc [Streptomyces agglomeratus]OEJ36400.1 toxin Doc [Streptomyces agglomeratus]OEJ56271.1 toxin Doc [Streptomyces agglomeratus]OEJ56579.1 toxin Doc [Streptomyces agglomeratus]